VPKRQNIRRRPNQYTVDGEWPHAHLEPSVPAEYAQGFARNLAEATAGLSLRKIARTADLDPMTIRAILRGESWPDMASVGKLEAAYRRLLWPADSTRRKIMSDALGDDPQTVRGRLETALDEAVDMLEAAWEAHYGTPMTDKPRSRAAPSPGEESDDSPPD